MAEDLSFKFSLDLSDFDKAPKVIEDALQIISDHARIQGKDTDLAIAGYMDSLIKERKNAIDALQRESEAAFVKWSELRSLYKNGLVSEEEVDKAGDYWNSLMDKLDQTRNELELLQEKENELAGNRSFMQNMRAKAQSLDLYGKAMSMLPAPIAQVIQANTKLNASLMKLLANPVVLTIAGIVLGLKALMSVGKYVVDYFDQLADRSDAVAYAFGVVTGAVGKIANAFKELLMLNVDGFLYNIKSIFDGGERELKKRNADLLRVEEEGYRERLQRENQWLRKRINNTYLDNKTRLEAEKKYTENLINIEKSRKKEIEDKYQEWAKENGWYDKVFNPNGWAKSITDLSGPLQVQLKEFQNEFARIDHSIATAVSEGRDRQAKLFDQYFDGFLKEMNAKIQMWEKQKAFQRQVYDSVQAENQRLKAMAQETENASMQAQINKMADGLEKATEQAKLKTKQSFEQLNKALYDEAKQLYENEKNLFESNPENEGKMFKRFNYAQYVKQAKKNIGFTVKEAIINSDEIETIKKTVDAIVKDALDGAVKVSNEVSDILTRIEDLSNDDLPVIFGGDVTLGFKEYLNDLKKIDKFNENAQRISEELIRLDKERLTLEMKLNVAQTDEEKESISNKIKENVKATNTALIAAKKNEEGLKVAADKVKDSYGKMLDSANLIADGISNCAEQFKGMSKSGDEVIETMQEMLSIVGRLASGDYIGAIIQVIVLAVQKTAEYFKTVKENAQKDKEWKQHMIDIYKSVTDAVYAYKQALIDAKYAQDEMWSNTNVSKMQKSIESLDLAKNKLEEMEAISKEQRTLQGVVIGSALYQQLTKNGAVRGTQRNIYNSGLTAYDFTGSYYDTLETGYQDITRRGELLKEVLAKRGMEQLFDANNEFNLKAYQALRENAEDAWNGLAEVDQKQLEKIAEVAEQYEEYIKTLQEGMADWYSPLLDDMTDAWMNWLDTGETVMDSFKEYSADTFKDIVKDMLKTSLYKEFFADYKEKISGFTETYLREGMSVEQYAKEIADATQNVMDDLQSDKYKTIIESWNDALKAYDINLTGDETSRTASERGIARASQESVDENNARLAMMQQHTYNINNNVTQLVQTSSQMLLHLSAIHDNTNRLAKIESSLANIETYGIKTR